MTDKSAVLTIIIFFALWLLLWLPFAIPLALKLKWRPFQPSLVEQKLPLLASLYLMAPLPLIGICHSQGTRFATYGMPLNLAVLPSFGWGLLTGSIGLATVFFLQQQLGWLQQAETGEGPELKRHRGAQVLLMLVLAIWVGWTEELIFRGFLQTELQHSGSAWTAATIASMIFALLHGIWEGKAVLPQLLGLWLMGMVLVLARWTDHGNLGLAWGLHAGWVWVIASLDIFQLTRYTDRVPAWVTGMGQKPLAGLIGILFLLASGGGLWWLQAN